MSVWLSEVRVWCSTASHGLRMRRAGPETERRRHIATLPPGPCPQPGDYVTTVMCPSLSSLSSNIHNWDSHLASSSGVIAAAGTAGSRLLTPTSATATHYKHANTEAINRLDRANKIDVWLPGCLLVKFKL